MTFKVDLSFPEISYFILIIVIIPHKLICPTFKVDLSSHEMSYFILIIAIIPHTFFCVV